MPYLQVAAGPSSNQSNEVARHRLLPAVTGGEFWVRR
jgi:hypothetical protein